MSLEKLRSVIRTLFVDEFGSQMMRVTDPVADYGVKYDQKTVIKYKGEELDAWYGTTPQKMPYWKMQLVKNMHGGVMAMEVEEFLKGNVLAFYWIHKRIFDQRGLSKEEITIMMRRLCEGIYQDHAQIDILLEPVSNIGEGKWDLFLRGVWEDIENEVRPEGFCTMTNIFPMDRVGRREIARVEVNKAVNNLIDTVRSTMDNVESFQNKKVIEEINYYTDSGLKFTGTSRTQNDRINRYYREYLGFTDEVKLQTWITTIQQNREVQSIEELAGYMGITPGRVHKMLQGTSLKPSKTQTLDKLLTESILKAKTKSEAIKISGKPRTTIYRRLKKNKALKFLWDQL